MKLLVDHDIEGYAVLLWGGLIAEGWLELAEIDFVMFTTMSLAFDSNDRNVWRFAQANGMMFGFFYGYVAGMAKDKTLALFLLIVVGRNVPIS